MRTDMELTGGLVMSESMAAALAPALGRADAQGLVEKAARQSVESGRAFREVLLELPAGGGGCSVRTGLTRRSIRRDISAWRTR